ncbi:neuroparsin-A-like [Anopheles aquasalis]|uniref:neuroparsin-A-like n=1 Tax=Anopheles aquasalis TaxID=42839 RepID=UPI00215A4680|nr:neuroparsin-A-like [Anopheles aquasalis]
MSSSGVLLITVLLMGYLYWSLAQPTNTVQIRCKITPAVPDERMCAYGAYISICDKLACKQGPGQQCGNDMDRDKAIKYGVCADGLDCCNDVCLGCYKDVCYTKSCNPKNTRTVRHHHYGFPSQQVSSFYRPYAFDYFNQ